MDDQRADEQRVDVDLNCLVCRYNLRGLRTTGNCTECGSPVVWAAHGSELLAADPKWLGTVRTGQGILTMTFLWGWFPLVWPLLIVGVLKLTRPAPRDAPALRDFEVPALLRWSLISLPALCLLLAFVLYRHGRGLSDYVPLDGYSDAAMLTATMAQWLILWGLFRMIRRSATSFFRKCSIAVILLSLASLLLMGIGHIGLRAGRTPGAYAWILALGIGCEAVALPLFMLIMARAWRRLSDLQIEGEAVQREVRAWDSYRVVTEQEHEAASLSDGSASANRAAASAGSRSSPRRPAE